MRKGNITKLALVPIAVLAGVFLISCSSDTNTLHTINGIQVPPDPGAAGKATLAGIDSNNNGVRDDVERFIAGEYGSNKELYNKAFEFSQIEQKLFTQEHTPDRNKTDYGFTINTPVGDFENYLSCSTIEELDSYVSTIDKLHLNTKERSNRYGYLLGGMAGSATGVSCEKYK